MEIYWHGQACFEIRSLSADSKTKTRTIIDPYSNSIGLKLPLLGADLLLMSHNNEENNNIFAVKDNPFVIQGPGEYEVKDVFVNGFFASRKQEDKKDLGRITVYIIEAEGIKICHLGEFSQKELLSEQLDKVGDVDILMIPVGGKYTIDGVEAQKIANQIEPKIIIPMNYKIPGLSVDIDGVSEFLKAMGQEDIEAEDCLKIKKDNLPSETKIILLKP
ncbi:MBL fold metallo-hydrolase [Patescibacteria group bacterium]|nr:MBL fold metallo-hydrolase [Patescibacteria group bacterium]MBU4023337.1 MBL fold metallo-hydrolase [Patescibacteria group bacterium]